jgi:hypothetical protein
MHKRDLSRLDDLAERETRAFLKRQAFEFIECAVNLAAHSASIAEVRAYLRALEAHLAEFG